MIPSLCFIDKFFSDGQYCLLLVFDDNNSKTFMGSAGAHPPTKKRKRKLCGREQTNCLHVKGNRILFWLAEKGFPANVWEALVHGFCLALASAFVCSCLPFDSFSVIENCFFLHFTWFFCDMDEGGV